MTNGAEISVEELNPNLIDPSLPTWEAFSAEVAQKQELDQQRADILEFQEKLDTVREQIADGDISEADLAELDAEILEVMPPAVKTHVVGLEMQGPEIVTNSVGQMRSAETTVPAPLPFR